MKIRFPLVSAGSGSDIFTSNLVSSLHKSSVTADIQFIPSCSGYIPFLASHLCNSSGYDIIHTNTWNGFAFSGDAPLVATEHLVVHDPVYNPYKTYSQKLYHRLIRSYEEKTLNCADMVVAVSDYVCATMKKVFGDYDVKVIHNGIDETRFYPSHVERAEFIGDRDVTLLLYTGNLSLRKGSDLLPKIMNRLGDRYLLLTTAGLRVDNCLNQDNIIHLGKLTVDELIRAYNVCDLFLFPSRLEGLSLSVLEAMACGKPVVTTNASSFPELIEMEKGGILCEMDDISGFVDAVRYLSEDENLQMKMGVFNRQRVLKKFSLEKMTSEYIKVYKRLLD